jgi:hypothetical protein
MIPSAHPIPGGRLLAEAQYLQIHNLAFRSVLPLSEKRRFVSATLFHNNFRSARPLLLAVRCANFRAVSQGGLRPLQRISEPFAITAPDQNQP